MICTLEVAMTTKSTICCAPIMHVLYENNNELDIVMQLVHNFIVSTLRSYKKGDVGMIATATVDSKQHIH